MSAVPDKTSVYTNEDLQCWIADVARSVVNEGLTKRDLSISRGYNKTKHVWKICTAPVDGATSFTKKAELTNNEPDMWDSSVLSSFMDMNELDELLSDGINAENTKKERVAEEKKDVNDEKVSEMSPELESGADIDSDKQELERVIQRFANFGDEDMNVLRNLHERMNEYLVWFTQQRRSMYAFYEFSDQHALLTAYIRKTREAYVGGYRGVQVSFPIRVSRDCPNAKLASAAICEYANQYQLGDAMSVDQ